MVIAEIMERAAKATRPYVGKLGSAVVQDIGQDAVLAVWEASERGEELDISIEVHRLCEREYKHVRKDQGIVTVPLHEAPEWMTSVNAASPAEPGLSFGMSQMAVPGVASMTRYELMLEAVQAIDGAAYSALLEWLETANRQYAISRASGGKRSGKPRQVPEALSGPIRDQLPAVLAWWAHRGRTRATGDWNTARAMSPTTEPVRTPAEVSDAEVSHYAREGKPLLRPTPVRVHTVDHEADGMAMLSFGPGRVNAPSRRGKREGQATISLGGGRQWGDVGTRH